MPNSKEYEHRIIKASTQENCFGTDMVTFAIQVPSNSIPTFANDLGELVVKVFNYLRYVHCACLRNAT